MRLTAIFASVLLVAIPVIATAVAQAQTPRITPPLSLPQAQHYQQNPQEWQQLLDRLSQEAQQFTPAAPLAPGQTPSAGGWTSLTNSPGVAVQNPLLMTDGTVIAMRPCTGQWYKLTPDITGSYINGTWTQIATMPSGYGPLFGGSAVLPDGRAIFEGGEYNDSAQSGNCGNGAWTSLGAIYDPVTNTWTAVSSAERLDVDRRCLRHRARQRHLYAEQLLQYVRGFGPLGAAQCKHIDVDGDRLRQARPLG